MSDFISPLVKNHSISFNSLVNIYGPSVLARALAKDLRKHIDDFKKKQFKSTRFKNYSLLKLLILLILQKKRKEIVKVFLKH